MNGLFFLKEVIHSTTSKKIPEKWIAETRELFRKFRDETDFPDPERLGKRGPKFKCPEWLIIFIAILSVKMKIKSYVQVHKMSMHHWDILGKNLGLKPISKRQLAKLYLVLSF